MAASKELFLRMSEEEYLQIPHEIRERHLSAKVYSQSMNDFQELMQDEVFAMHYGQYKQSKGFMEERQFQLRELKRKFANIEVKL